MFLGTSSVTAKGVYGNVTFRAFCSDFCCFAALFFATWCLGSVQGSIQHLYPTVGGAEHEEQDLWIDMILGHG